MGILETPDTPPEVICIVNDITPGFNEVISESEAFLINFLNN